MVVEDLEKLKKLIGNRPIALTSMPGDPIHPGHISCLQAIKPAIEKHCKTTRDSIVTVCVVNDDNFLVNKKGFAFMPLKDRMDIIDNIKDGVDYVVPFHPSNPKDQTVCEAINILKPIFFMKGGDRTADETLPEWGICKAVGCTIVDHVGADKIWSSSNYLANYKKFILSNANA